MANVEDECDMCFEYQRCSGEKCTKHTLYDGHILDYARAMRDGKLWGDIIYEEEQEARAKETKEEREKRLKKETERDRKAMDNLREAAMNKDHVKHCVKMNGRWVLKHKYPTKCQNLKLPDTVLPDGSTYPGGCWAYEEGVCPYIHPDEEGKFDFKGRRKIVLVKNSNNNTTTRRWKGGKQTRKHRK
jgi:hypothetical protein